MRLKIVEEGKRDYLPLLLMGDEQESMIDRYLDRGTLYVLEDGEGAAAVCVVTREGEALWEIKNLAVRPDLRRQGIGRELVAQVCRRCPGGVLQVGAGETPGTLKFYRACGFVPSRRVPDFFTRHYDHPIVEEGVLLRDMIYLEKPLP